MSALGRTIARVPRLLGFMALYLADMLRAATRVAHDVLTPTSHMRPGLLEYRLRVRTDAQIAVLANLVSLTPGTLSLDVSPDRSTLLVHAMFAHDEQAQIRALEDRVLALWRGPER